jgi:hypothetical protein
MRIIVLALILSFGSCKNRPDSSEGSEVSSFGESRSLDSALQCSNVVSGRSLAMIRFQKLAGRDANYKLEISRDRDEHRQAPEEFEFLRHLGGTAEFNEVFEFRKNSERIMLYFLQATEATKVVVKSKDGANLELDLLTCGSTAPDVPTIDLAYYKNLLEQHASTCGYSTSEVLHLPGQEGMLVEEMQSVATSRMLAAFSENRVPGYRDTFKKLEFGIRDRCRAQNELFNEAFYIRGSEGHWSDESGYSESHTYVLLKSKRRVGESRIMLLLHMESEE